MSLLRSRYVRYITRKLRLPNDEENVRLSMENIKSGAIMTSANLWVLVCAIFIASLGLNTNSTAVIIGAMLVSPLMGPIMGFGLGLGVNDIALIKKSTRNFVMMVVISVAASTLYFLISPVKEAGSELLGRTSPTLYDVLIAIFGGFAGIIAGASKLRRSNVIPGVAIATALMPPLCTMGYGLSSFNWQYTLGAFYLFMINSVFIALSTYFIVNLLDYPNVNKLESGGKKRIYWIISFLVVLMIAPSIYLTYHIVKKYFYKQSAETFVQKEIQSPAHIVVNSKFDYKPAGSELELVMMGDMIDSTGLDALKKKMKDYGLKDCKLVLYQGPDSRAAARGMFNELSTDMRVQSLSIKDLYIRMDSMQEELNKPALFDSLQAGIAREMKGKDSTLNRLSLERSFGFNPSKNAKDTLWRVTMSFAEAVNFFKRREYEEWLKQRLQSPDVTMVIE